MTWQHDLGTTITLNLHGLATSPELTIYYDSKPHFSNLSEYRYKLNVKGIKQTQIPDKRILYCAELKSLIPGERYYFTVADGQKVLSDERHFTTVPLDAPIRFVEGGDWEVTPEAEELAKKAAELSPHATLLGGDYPSKVFTKRGYKKWDAWLDIYEKTMVTPSGDLIPLVLSIGNHEVIGGYHQQKKEVPFFFDYFCQGETKESYFSLECGKRLALFVLDSGHVSDHGGEQSHWLKKQLEEHKEIPVKIALYHVPLYPCVRFVEKDIHYRSIYGLTRLFGGRRKADKLLARGSSLGRKYWLPLFDEYGLTVAFEHHDQALKRTKLLRNGVEAPDGTLYLGDGGWGAEKLYPPIQGYFNSHFAHLIGKVHFFWFIEIEEGKIFYAAINTKGEILDNFEQKF